MVVAVAPVGDRRVVASGLAALRDSLRPRTAVVVRAGATTPAGHWYRVVEAGPGDLGLARAALGAHPAAAVVVVPSDAVADRGWAEALVGALGDDPGAGRVAVPAGNGEPWPWCPADAPDARSRPAEVRAFARSLAAGAPGPQSLPAPGAVPAVFAAHPRALDAWPSSVVLTNGVYVHRSVGVPLVSACLIVRDEAERLGACLASLAGLADELVVHDTGSTDDTVAVARAGGAVVIEGAWPDDFGAAREVARRAARGAWVLSVDADEVVECTAADASALRRALAAGVGFDIGRIPLVDDDAGVRSTQPAHLPRLFRRLACRWVGAVHEQPVGASGRRVVTAVLDGPLLVHHGYGRAALAAKAARNARLARAGLGGADEARARFDLGRSLALGGDPGAAATELASAVALAADPALRRGALTHLVRALADAGRGVDAVEAAARLDEAAPGAPVSALLGAMALLARGQSGDAEAAAARVAGVAAVVDDTWVSGADDTRTVEAAALLAAGRPADALGALEAALAVQPRSPRAWSLVAELLDADPALAGDVRRLVDRHGGARGARPGEPS